MWTESLQDQTLHLPKSPIHMLSPRASWDFMEYKDHTEWEPATVDLL